MLLMQRISTELPLKSSKLEKLTTETITALATDIVAAWKPLQHDIIAHSLDVRLPKPTARETWEYLHVCVENDLAQKFQELVSQHHKTVELFQNARKAVAEHAQQLFGPLIDAVDDLQTTL